jgi:hypothetical protein
MSQIPLSFLTKTINSLVEDRSGSVRSFAHGFDISLKGHAALSCFAYYELHTDNPIDRGSAHDSDTRELQGLLAAAVRSIYDRETFVEFAHAMPLGGWSAWP